MIGRRSKQTGFTIVELLIVIVVIGILAAITIVAYNGIQNRARDTRRIDDIAKIRKGLEMYRAVTGEYPPATNSAMANSDATVPGSGWESSSFGLATWMNRLAPYISPLPVDPVNDNLSYYYYVFYKNNSAQCGAQTPNCYVLGISKLDGSNALEIPGVDKTSTDSWRSTTLVNRPVWRGSY